MIVAEAGTEFFAVRSPPLWGPVVPGSTITSLSVWFSLGAYKEGSQAQEKVEVQRLHYLLEQVRGRNLLEQVRGRSQVGSSYTRPVSRN